MGFHFFRRITKRAVDRFKD
uniref:Uncharacterized protein n=1 Tax=Arundo donax TaxID=35708 RepID=A0A0A9AXS9_ARUDO